MFIRDVSTCVGEVLPDSHGGHRSRVQGNFFAALFSMTGRILPDHMRKSTSDVETLRAALLERDIQMEAMTRFERESDQEIQKILDQKDEVIQKLQNELQMLSSTQAQVEDGNKLLQRLVSERERDVEELESRMRMIHDEKSIAEKSLRDSMSDSMLEYESRVDQLRRDIASKDGELQQLRETLGSIPKIHADVDRESDLLKQVSELQEELANVRKISDERWEELAELRARVLSRPSLTISSSTPILIPSTPLPSESELVLLQEVRTRLLEKLESFPDRAVTDFIAHHASESELLQIALQQVDEFRHLAETYRSEAKSFESALRGAQNEGGTGLAAMIEGVLASSTLELANARRSRSSTRELTVCTVPGACLHPLVETNDQMKKLKLQLSQANRRIAEFEETPQKSSTDLSVLRTEIQRLKSLAKKPRVQLDMVTFRSVAISSEPSARPEVLSRLRDELYLVQDENFGLRKRIEVEFKLTADLERLKLVTSENENIKLKARIDDLEFHLGKLGAFPKNQAVEEELMRLRLEIMEGRKRMQIGETEKAQKNLEIVRLKNRIVELEFDINVLQVKLERERDDTFRSSRPADYSEDSSRLKSTINELQRERLQDKAALAEAEKVLNMVQATEQKYMKVAKENAKLKKDIAALDDENFWNDLEKLQNQHKECVGLLRNIRDGKAKSDTLLGEIVRLVGAS
jgi:hypothetical protein